MTAGVPDRSASRHDDLLRIATELFSEHGYERTSVRMIAERMGILSGSLYSHISRKEDILRELVLGVGTRFLDAATAARALAPDPVEALHALCRAHLRVVDEQQTAVIVYYNEWRKLEPAVQAEIIVPRERYQQIFADVIAEGTAAGVFAVRDPRAAVLVVLSTLNWSSQWYRPDGALSHAQIADWCVDVILRGLRPR